MTKEKKKIKGITFYLAFNHEKSQNSGARKIASVAYAHTHIIIFRHFHMKVFAPGIV